MWNRAQLKDKAKFALKHNYWKCVLVAMIFGLIAGGTSASLTTDMTEEIESALEEENTVSGLDYSDQYENDDNSEDYWEGYYDGYFGDEDEHLSRDYADGYNDGLLDQSERDTASWDGIFEQAEESKAYGFGVALILIAVCVVLFIIILAVSLLWSAFLLNPLQMGCNRFFFIGLNRPAEVKEVAFGFDNNYKNIMKILFARSLYTMLWGLLFWIPGIVKSYEYRMIPYLLAENPNLTKEQAFAMSKQMMSGNKWKAFVLDLSFIGWDLLSVCTLGILDTFYVAPYKHLTNAALYEQLSLINGRPAFAAQQPNMGAPVQPQPMQMNPFAQSEEQPQEVSQSHVAPQTSEE